MIGIDTNVLVCYLAQDDPVQSTRATRIFERTLTASEPGFINLVTMAETVWVLDRSYGMSGQKIASVIERILQADTLVVQNEQEVFTAMAMLRSGEASFSDALIGALGTWAGCSSTLTFGRRAARLPAFTLV